jgi:hypothetical protein
MPRRGSTTARHSAAKDVEVTRLGGLPLPKWHGRPFKHDRLPMHTVICKITLK